VEGKYTLKQYEYSIEVKKVCTKMRTGKRAETLGKDSTWTCPVDPIAFAVLVSGFVVVHVAGEAEQTCWLVRSG
jgi:hypothetical protein